MKSRGRLTEPKYGGKQCPPDTETQPCNTHSCDQDCVLSEWSAWSPCTKSCLGKWSWTPGGQSRTKSIVKPVVGGGKCWRPHQSQRLQHQRCNTFICPKGIKCVADMDVIMVQDGSGSLWYRWGGKAHWNRNFELSKKFMQALVADSVMAKVDAMGRPKDGLRFGVILFSWGAKVISQVTEKKADLDTKIKAMKWPMGGTMTHRALLLARKMFLNTPGSKNRLQTVLLLTDGRAMYWWWTYWASWLIKRSGVRLITIAVKNAVRIKWMLCLYSSRPCRENLILTPRWTMLISKLKLYLTTMCPTVEVPSPTR